MKPERYVPMLVGSLRSLAGRYPRRTSIRLARSVAALQRDASCTTARRVYLIYTHLGTHCHGLPATCGAPRPCDACSAGSEAVSE